MITIVLTDTAGAERPVMIDTVHRIDWTITGLPMSAVPKAPPLDTIVTATFAHLSGAVTAMAVRYREVAYVERHYGSIIAANAKQYAKDHRA